MRQNISRRDFLDGTLLASGAALLTASAPIVALSQSKDWTGYSGEGDYKGSAGNTDEVIRAAHAVRDGAFDRKPEDADTGELYDLVVVGGGFAGLSAGLFFQQRTKGPRTCLILDNARVFGGVA